MLEIHKKRYCLSNVGIEVLTLFENYFFISNLNMRDEIYEDIQSWMTNLSYANKNKLERKNKERLHISARRKKKMQIDNPISKINSEKVFLISLGINKILENWIIPSWEQGKLSNYNYLMLLNLCSGRTFNDLSQYPIFPWIISNYTSNYGELNLNNKDNYRDLSKPIGTLTKERLLLAKNRFKQSLETEYCPPFNFGSHYSMPNLLFYFLIRLMPFSKLAYNLQGGKFDLSDRLFHSFEDSWNISTNLDNQEVIPEIFYLPEFLLNLSNFNFGTNSYQKKVKDVILPRWSYFDPRFFVKFQRKALESVYVSTMLNQWIDLIFGYKQVGIKAVEAFNVYYFLTYESNIDFSKCKNNLEMKSLLDQINEYGQTPVQLFAKHHSEKKKIENPSAFFYSPKTLKEISPNLVFSLKNTQIMQNGKCNCKDFIAEINKKNDFSERNIYDYNSGLGSFGNECEELLYAYNNKIVKSITKEDEDNDFLNQYDISYFGNKIYEGNSILGNCEINYTNCYDSFFIYKQEEKFQTFKHSHEKITYLNTKASKNQLIVGDINGEITLYKFFKDKAKNKTNSNVGFSFRNSSIYQFSHDFENPVFKIASVKQNELDTQRDFNLNKLKFTNYKQIPKFLIDQTIPFYPSSKKK